MAIDHWVVIRITGSSNPITAPSNPITGASNPITQSEYEEEYVVDEFIKQQHSEEMKNIKDDYDFEFTFAFEFLHQLFFTKFPHFKRNNPITGASILDNFITGASNHTNGFRKT